LTTATVEEAKPLYRQASMLLYSAGAIARVAVMLSTSGFVAVAQGAYSEADRMLAEALELSEGIDDPHLRLFIRGNQGLAFLFLDRYPEAAAAFADELRLARIHGFSLVYFEGTMGLAAVAAVYGDLHRAALLQGAAQVLDVRPYLATERPVFEVLEHRFLEPARERLGDETWQRVGDRGRALSVGAALETALEGAPTCP
jgi:hypothetical protein